MVFGGIETERIQLNEESLWTGGAVDRANPEALKYLNEVRQLLFEGKSTHPNLFDKHPPFQIDGNFGAVAGITEMLMQSQLGVIRILPALPDEWQSGQVKGLRTRGGFEVDIEWEEGDLKQLKVKSLLGKPCIIRYKDKIAEPEISAGNAILLNRSLLVTTSL